MSRPIVRPLGFILTLLVAGALVALVVWPQLLGLHTALGFAQLVSFRALLAAALGVAAVICAVIAFARRRFAVAAALAVVLAAAAAVGAGLLFERSDRTDAEAAASDLVVLAWNTERAGPGAERIARLVADEGADVVMLPETGEADVDAVADRLRADGLDYFADTTYGDRGEAETPTSVLIAAHLGEYALDEAAGSTPWLPSGVWRPVDGTGPVIVAAHPVPPVPWAMAMWRDGLSWLAAQCTAGDTIVAGDLNATVDHLSGLGDHGVGVGRCRDAGSVAGGSAAGTWPTALPVAWGTPIDHVLAGDAWTVRDFRVVTSVDEAGSDHRPVIAVLTPTATHG